MRVCLLNESFPPVIDGVANVLLNYAKYLQEMGCEVIIGTPAYPGADYSSYPYPVVAYHSFPTEEFASGYRTGNPFTEKAVSELAAFEPDIIHSHCPASANIVARLLREKTGAPIVFTYHTKYDIDIERWVKVKAIANEGVKAMVGNIEACDEVWAVSQGAGESLQALGFSGAWSVMNNGVDFEKGRVSDETVKEAVKGYDLPEQVPVFLFVGRLISYKGIPIILDALKILADRGMDFRMVFIGKGPDREKFEKCAAEYGIGEKCIFVGPIYDREVLRAWNTRADLFLFPSTFDTNGLVVREAAACGLASVLIRDSCASEGVTDRRNGFIIEENAQSMADLLLECGNNLNYLHEVGQYAMNEIYMSWADCVQEAYRRYQVILEKKENGLLPERKKDLTDYLVTMTAFGMSEKEKGRNLRKEIFHDFRETAEGMAENIREVEDELEQSVQGIKDSIREAEDEFEQSVQGIKDSIREAEDEFGQSVQEIKEDIREAEVEFEQSLQGIKDRWENMKDDLKADWKKLKEGMNL